MRYPIAIEPGDDRHTWGVVVPDLPGCFSAGDSGIDEAMENAKEAIALWIETVIDDGGVVPPPTNIETHRNDPDLQGFVWAYVDVDLSAILDDVERVNITLPARILRRLDAAAKREGDSRSGYIAKLALRGPAAMPATKPAARAAAKGAPATKIAAKKGTRKSVR